MDLVIAREQTFFQKGVLRDNERLSSSPTVGRAARQLCSAGKLLSVKNLREKGKELVVSRHAVTESAFSVAHGVDPDIHRGRRGASVAKLPGQRPTTIKLSWNGIKSLTSLM